MPRQSPQMNSRASRLAGFSTVELLIVGALLTVVTTFGFLGITKARASVRLSGAARQMGRFSSFKGRLRAGTEEYTRTHSASDYRSSHDIIKRMK